MLEAPITQASEHTAEEALTSYCDVADVRSILAGVEADDAGVELSNWLSQSAADAVIEMYLSDKKQLVDSTARRDFDLHEDVDVVVDGPGESLLNLGKSGFYPLLSVSALTVANTEQELDNYVLYRDGVIKSKLWGVTQTFVNPAIARTFPRGNQNIAATITWGYAAVPQDVVMAQARFVAAEVLAHIARANTETPGMIGGIQKVEFEDYRITNFARSRFSASIERLEKQATKDLAAYRTYHAESLKTSPEMSSRDTAGGVYGRHIRGQVTVDREPV